MDLLGKIFDAGIVGAGGAGFPTHMKLNCQVEYFLVNAAECEPLLNTDKYIMGAYPDAIVEACEMTAELVSAKHAYIAVKAINGHVVKCLQDTLDRKKSNVKLFLLDNYYPAGDEQMIVFDVTGRTVPPGGIPLDVGAVVSNVATLLNIYEAASGKPVTHKYLTVAGQVKSPAVLKVPIGTPFAACIEAAGGTDLIDYKVVNGGPMMGKVADCKDLDRLYVSKTTSGILVIAKDSNFVARTDDLALRQILNRAKSACIQCCFCTDLCPRKLIGHDLNPNQIMRHMAVQDLNQPLTPDDVLEQARVCCECGVCETFACPMGLSPRQVNKFVKGQLPPGRYNRKKDSWQSEPLREYRKIAPKKIMARMGLLGLYESKAERFLELNAGEVTLSLRQSIGALAVPLVKDGDLVESGQLIARAEDGKPSANLHASIKGVATVSGDSITIKGGVY